MDRKGRVIDLAQCLIQPNSVLLLVSPSRRKALLSRLDQYIFFGDKVPTPSPPLPACMQCLSIAAAWLAYPVLLWPGRDAKGGRMTAGGGVRCLGADSAAPAGGPRQ